MRGRNTQKPRISVLVVAVDDGDGLRRCLARLREQAEALAAEVVLVINAAEDGLAPAAVANLRATCDVLAFEPAVGKSNALNTGVSLCRGEVIAFTDDDAVPHPGWLKAITEPLLAVDRPASRAGTGGRVVPVYPDGGPPAWYRRLVEDKEEHFLGPAHDLGDAPRVPPVAVGRPRRRRPFLRSWDGKSPSKRWRPVRWVRPTRQAICTGRVWPSYCREPTLGYCLCLASRRDSCPIGVLIRTRRAPTS